MTSKAFRKSIKTRPVTSSLSMFLRIRSVSLIKAVSVECPDLKADRSSYNKLLSRKKTDRELATCFSRIFERIGKTDIGR